VVHPPTHHPPTPPQVTQDVDSMSFNTAIAAMMVFSNHLWALKQTPRSVPHTPTQPHSHATPRTPVCVWVCMLCLCLDEHHCLCLDVRALFVSG
jgi:hypothetical protein